MKDIDIQDVIAQAPNRRRFVEKLGMASAALGALTLSGSRQADAQSGHPNDVDILNFAFNLEYL